MCMSIVRVMVRGNSRGIRVLIIVGFPVATLAAETAPLSVGFRFAVAIFFSNNAPS